MTARTKGTKGDNGAPVPWADPKVAPWYDPAWSKGEGDADATTSSRWDDGPRTSVSRAYRVSW